MAPSCFPPTGGMIQRRTQGRTRRGATVPREKHLRREGKKARPPRAASRRARGPRTCCRRRTRRRLLTCFTRCCVRQRKRAREGAQRNQLVVVCRGKQCYRPLLFYGGETKNKPRHRGKKEKCWQPVARKVDVLRSRGGIHRLVRADLESPTNFLPNPAKNVGIVLGDDLVRSIACRMFSAVPPGLELSREGQS